jgi:hypothetical protein
MERYLLFLMFAIALSAGVAGVVVADGGPLAAAGLDQEVGVNTTVQLDGTGSSHPDGRIEGYAWSIETPYGRTMTPACRDCSRTRFTPHEPGRYDVTLTVTDGEGRTDSDTLYVYVEEAGPTVELRGDAEPAVDDPTPYNASARARGADLETLTWKLGNRTVARESMDGRADWTRRSFSFTEADTYRLVVVARDGSNRTARETLTVEPRNGSVDAGGDSGAGGPAISNFSTAADGGETSDGCEKAAVVGNPTGTGPPAAVTCADGRNQEDIDKWADETCSSDLRDCEYVDPDGLGSPEYNQPDEDNGDGYSGGDITYQRNNPGNSSGTTNGGRNGGDGYIGVI